MLCKIFNGLGRSGNRFTYLLVHVWNILFNPLVPQRVVLQMVSEELWDSECSSIDPLLYFVDEDTTNDHALPLSIFCIIMTKCIVLRHNI